MPKKQYKSFSAGALPWTMLEELPQTHSRLAGEGDTLSLFHAHPLDAFGVSLLCAFSASISAPVAMPLIVHCVAYDWQSVLNTESIARETMQINNDNFMNIMTA